MQTMHLRAPRKPGQGIDFHGSICGMRCTPLNLVDHPAATTCRLCLRKVRSDARKSVYKQLLLDHAAEQLAPSSDVVRLAVPVAYTSRAHRLSLADLLIIARARQGDAQESRAAFPTVSAAVRALAAYIDEGASVTSSSSPSRFEGIPRGSRSGVVSNVERMVDRIVGVRKAIDAAYASGMRFGALELSPSICKDIFVWRHAGRPYFASKRRDCVQRRKAESGWILREVLRLTGQQLTEHQASLVVRHGNAAVGDYLRRTGEVEG